MVCVGWFSGLIIGKFGIGPVIKKTLCGSYFTEMVLGSNGIGPEHKSGKYILAF